MADRVLADVTIAAHFAFLVFVVAGGFLARRWRWLMVPHLVGRAGDGESFIEHYLMPIIYPDGLTRPMQWGIAGSVVAVNVIAYARPQRRSGPWSTAPSIS